MKMTMKTKTTRWACPNCSGDYFEHPVFLRRYVGTKELMMFCPECGCHTTSPEDDLCLLTGKSLDVKIAA